jgi:hypothetical protein
MAAGLPIDDPAHTPQVRTELTERARHEPSRSLLMARSHSSLSFFPRQTGFALARAGSVRGKQVWGLSRGTNHERNRRHARKKQPGSKPYGSLPGRATQAELHALPLAHDTATN